MGADQGAAAAASDVRAAPARTQALPWASGMVALSCGIRQCFATNSATTTTREALPRLTFHSVRMPLFLGYPRVGAIAYTFWRSRNQRKGGSA